MRRTDPKLTKRLRDYAENVVNKEEFETLVEEVEKAYYADWRQSEDVETREDVWHEYQGFKRAMGTFRGLNMTKQLEDKRTGDGKK